MTVVSDLVARFRADTTDFDSALHRSESAAREFGNEMHATDEKLLRVKDAAGVAATAIGGTFAGGILAAVELTKSYNSELEQLGVQYNAIFGSSTAGSAQVAMVEDFGAKMGIATSQVANMNKELELSTQGAHNSQADWQKMTDVAAAHGMAVDQVAGAYARAFEVMKRAQITGSGGGAMATRGLLSEHLISPEAAAAVDLQIRQGADLSKVWATMTSEAEKYKGAGDAAANTMRGIMTTFHAEMSQDVGEAFAPLYSGVKGIFKSINEVLASQGVREVVHSIADDIGGLMRHFDDLGAHITSFGHKINGEGLADFKRHLHDIGPELGLVSGLMAEFGTEFIGRMPIINRFAGPFIQFLDDGRGGLLGLILASSQGRDAIVNLGGAFFDLIKALLGTDGALTPILHVIQNVAAFFINAAAAVVEFIARHQGIIAFAGAVLVLWEAIKLGAAVMRGLDAVVEFFTGLQRKINDYVDAYGKKKAVEEEGDALTRTSIATNQALAASIRELVAALDAETQAQLSVNAARTGSGLGTAPVTPIATGPAAVAPITGSAAAASTVVPTTGGMSGLSYGLMGGAAIGGGLLTAAGMQMHNRPMTAAGMAVEGGLAGAMIGTAIPVPGGTLIGAGIGAALGGLTGIFMNLGHSADEASAALKKIKSENEKWTQSNAPDTTNFASMKAASERFHQHADDVYRAPRAAIDADVQQLRNLGVKDVTFDSEHLPNISALKNEYAGDVRDPHTAAVMNAIDQADTDRKTLHGAYKITQPGVGDVDQSFQNARDLLNVVHHAAPGVDRQMLESLANKSGVHLGEEKQVGDDGLPNKTFEANVQRIIASMGPMTDDGKLYAPGGLVPSQWADIATTGVPVKGQGLMSIAGTQGQQHFTMTNAMMGALGSVEMGMQDRSVIDAYIKTGALKQDAKGITGDTSASVNNQIALLDIQHEQVTTAHNLEEASYALSQAQYGEGQAAHAAEKAAQGLEQAQIGLAKAQFELGRAMFDSSVENANQANSLAHLGQAALGHTDTFYNFSTTVMKLSDEHKGLAGSVELAVTAAAHAQDRYDDVNRTYTEMSNQLTILTDKQKQYQEIMNRPLAGSTKYDRELRANTNAQDAIKLQMDDLKLQGVYDKDPRMTALQYQLNVLSTQRDTIETHKDLNIGAKEDQLKLLVQASNETDFKSALRAAENVSHLNKQVQHLTDEVNTQKVKVDEASASYDHFKTRADLMAGALDNVASSDQNLIQQHERLKDATNAVRTAFIGVADAQYAIKDADHNIETAHHAVRDAAYSVKDAEYAAEKQTLSSKANAATAMGDLVGKGANFGHLAVEAAGDQVREIFKMAMDNLPPDVKKAVQAWLDATTASHPTDSRLVNPSRTSAEGNVFIGGMEDHSPAIYGTVHGQRVFNEPETGGEAYIPLGANKRSTALPILQQVNALLGVKSFADGGVNVDAVLATIRTMESGGNYGIHNHGNLGASGAYQYMSSTWQAMEGRAGFGGAFPYAFMAPANVQDAVARWDVTSFLASTGNNVGLVPLHWYYPAAISSWPAMANYTPPENAISLGAYQHNWLAKYGQLAGLSPDQLAHYAQTGGTGGGGGGGGGAGSSDAAFAVGMRALGPEMTLAGFAALPVGRMAVESLAGIGAGLAATSAIAPLLALGALGGAVPHYAEGGFALTPHLALVGDKPEAIVPLDRMGGMGTHITIADGAISVDIVVHGNAPDDIADEVRDAVSDALHNLVSSVRAKAG